MDRVVSLSARKGAHWLHGGAQNWNKFVPAGREKSKVCMQLVMTKFAAIITKETTAGCQTSNMERTPRGYLLTAPNSCYTFSSFYNSQAKHDREMKLTSIDFSHQGPEYCRGSWPQTLFNQSIHHSHSSV